jgi:hypothetical protein
MPLAGQQLIIPGRIIWLLRYTSGQSRWNSTGNNLFHLHPSPPSIQSFTPFIYLSRSLLSRLKLQVKLQLHGSDGTVLSIWKFLRRENDISYTHSQITQTASYYPHTRVIAARTHVCLSATSSSFRDNPRNLLILLLNVLFGVQVSFFPHSFLHEKDTGAVATLNV